MVTDQLCIKYICRSHKEFHRLSHESQCLLNEQDKCRLPSPYYDGGDFVINYH